MKTVKQLIEQGLKIRAHSSNGAFEVTSYIAIRNGRRVYGYFNHTLNQYIETSAPKH